MIENKLNQFQVFEFIRFLRRSNEIKSESIAAKIGISQSQYSKLENGKLNNYNELIPRIIQFYKMDVKVFWESFENYKMIKLKPSSSEVDFERQFIEKLLELEQKNVKMLQELVMFVQRRYGD